MPVRTEEEKLMRPFSRPLRAIAPAAAILAFALSACASTSSSPRAPSATAQSLRTTLERTYEEQRQKMLARDAEAVIAMRTGDFQVTTPDGTIHGAEEMAGFTRDLLARLVQWIELSNTLGAIERNGDEVSVEVAQHSIRMMRRADGVHRIENWVNQRETWLITPQGLRMRRVENIRDQRVLVDGKPRQ
jgi:hypothetical protein